MMFGLGWKCFFWINVLLFLGWDGRCLLVTLLLLCINVDYISKFSII